MITSTTTGVRHWSDVLRFLAPGPIALGMQSCLDPAVWHATWGAIAQERRAAQTPDTAQTQDTDESTARRSER